MKKESAIRIKYDKTMREYLLLSKIGFLGDSHIGERKECKTCDHLRKVNVVKEELFDQPTETAFAPIGICTLGKVWRVVADKKASNLTSCARLTMNIKDTFV